MEGIASQYIGYPESIALLVHTFDLQIASAAVRTLPRKLVSEHRNSG